MTDASALHSVQGNRTRYLVASAWIACALTWLILFIDVEPVVVAGPIITILGIIMIFVGTNLERADVRWLGICHVALCAVFVALVNINGWGPNAAFKPFVAMGICYLAATALPTRKAFHYKTHVPGICDACNYPLVGLEEPRCPECGKPFAPTELFAFSSRQPT